MSDLLIVDDDNDLSELLADVLRDRGDVIRVARNGREGIHQVDERRPDLVLLDVEMPVLDGPGMAYGLFIKDMGREFIPVVLLSGVSQLPRVAARVGTPYFLSKPYMLDELFALIDRALIERTPPRPPSTDAPTMR